MRLLARILLKLRHPWRLCYRHGAIVDIDYGCSLCNDENARRWERCEQAFHDAVRRLWPKQ